MPVRTHERRQASRGGLNGSDGSGRTLLAVRNKAQRRSVEVGENGRDALRLGKRGLSAHHAGDGAERGAQVALLGGVAGTRKVVMVGML